MHVWLVTREGNLDHEMAGVMGVYFKLADAQAAMRDEMASAREEGEQVYFYPEAGEDPTDWTVDFHIERHELDDGGAGCVAAMDEATQDACGCGGGPECRVAKDRLGYCDGATVPEGWKNEDELDDDDDEDDEDEDEDQDDEAEA